MKANPIIYNEIKDYFKLDSEGNLWGLQCNKWIPIYLSKPNSPGYPRVYFEGKRYLQHRIIYCLHTEQDIPVDLFIDHINGIRNDNRIENLQLVTHRGNNQNTVHHRDGKLVGCYRHSHNGKWLARIVLSNDGCVSLGLFNTEEEGHTRYQEALKLIHLTKEEIQKHFNVAQKQKTSKYTGVCWCKNTCKWKAQVKVNGKSKYIGSFDSEEEAYEAYIKFKGGVTSDTI